MEITIFPRSDWLPSAICSKAAGHFLTCSEIHLLVLSPQLKLQFCFSAISSELRVVVPLNECTAGAAGICWNNGMRTIQVVLAHCSDGWSQVLFVLQEFWGLFASERCLSSGSLCTPRGHWGTLVLWNLHSWHFPVLIQGFPGRKCRIAAISAGCFLHTPLLLCLFCLF